MQRLYARHLAATLLFLATFLVAACGSGNNNENFGPNQSTNGFAGRYLGTAALNEGKTGSLDVLVNALGQATGTFTVTSPVSAQTLTISLPNGQFPITGFVNPNGQFSLQGSFPGIGAFSLTGFLPQLNTPGSFTLNVNGQTATGVLPVPGSTTSPSPSPSASNTTSPSPTATPAVNNLVATFIPGPTAPNFDTSPISVLTFWQTSFTSNSLFANLQNGGDALNSTFTTPFRRIQVNIDGGNIAAGQEFDLSGTNNPHGVLFGSRTAPATFGFWRATSGKLRITEVSGNIVTIVGEDLEMVPAPGGTQGNAVGSFQLDFQSRFDQTVDKLL